MQKFPKITLKKGKESSLKRFHPWVFSGAIAAQDASLADGDIVTVHAWNNEFLGIGHFQSQLSIRVRIFSFQPVQPDYNFWKGKIEQAYAVRKSMGLADAAHTTAYRLVFAEGDGLPGLIIDMYGAVAVMQTHTSGMYAVRKHLAMALKEIYGEKLMAVYDKSKDTLPGHTGHQATNEYLLGTSAGHGEVLEHGNQFFVDWEQGQKTGFFIDQRENRALLARYAAQRNVLNAFCYTGGFSVYALQGGATSVHSVDVSKPAMDITEKNVALNKPNSSAHQAHVADVFDYLTANKNQYDLIILDPPAFAKHRSARHKATNGYKFLNAEAIKNIRPGGIIFTFSCSQVVDKTLFHSTVMAAAIQTGRPVRVLHHLGHPPDHPVSMYHPEGEYLKGLVLYVE